MLKERRSEDIEVMKMLKFWMFVFSNNHVKNFQISYIYDICQNKFCYKSHHKGPIVVCHNNVISMNNYIVVVEMIHLKDNLKHDNLKLTHLWNN